MIFQNGRMQTTSQNRKKGVISMIPKRVYLRAEELEVHFTCKRMASCDEPFDCCNVEYTALSQLWHDASEIPDRNHQNIIYQQKYCSMFNIYITYLPTCVRSCKITQKSWKEFVGENNVKRWAYVNDLLPKGGE